MQRQQKLAESYADVNLRKIVATSATLQKWALPSTLLNTNIKRVDTNYTFTQWQVVFSVDDNSFVQVFVKPTNFIGIPILNFEKDFLIDHISYEK